VLWYIDTQANQKSAIEFKCSNKCGKKCMRNYILDHNRRLAGLALTGGIALSGLLACTPTVQVAMPSEPITINLNVRIEHEIRVRVERELDDIFTEDSGLF
jgi:hypothetical protein